MRACTTTSRRPGRGSPASTMRTVRPMRESCSPALRPIQLPTTGPSARRSRRRRGRHGGAPNPLIQEQSFELGARAGISGGAVKHRGARARWSTAISPRLCGREISFAIHHRAGRTFRRHPPTPGAFDLWYWSTTTAASALPLRSAAATAPAADRLVPPSRCWPAPMGRKHARRRRSTPGSATTRSPSTQRRFDARLRRWSSSAIRPARAAPLKTTQSSAGSSSLRRPAGVGPARFPGHQPSPDQPAPASPTTSSPAWSSPRASSNAPPERRHQRWRRRAEGDRLRRSAQTTPARCAEARSRQIVKNLTHLLPRRASAARPRYARRGRSLRVEAIDMAMERDPPPAPRLVH